MLSLMETFPTAFFQGQMFAHIKLTKLYIICKNEAKERVMYSLTQNLLWFGEEHTE